MTFLVVGEYYSTNLGDPLICETVASIIQDNYKNAKIIPFDISGKKSMTEKYELHNKSLPIGLHRKLKLFPFYKKYLNKKKMEKKYRFLTEPLNKIKRTNRIDLIVFAGGEMFMDYFAERIRVIVDSFKNTPIIFHACGMYYLSDYSKRLFCNIISKDTVKSVSVRDSYYKFVEYFGKEKITDTYDTALLCSLYFKPSEVKKFELGIGIIDRDDCFEFQVNLVKNVQKTNVKWQLFSNGSESDYNTALKILKQVGICDNEIKHYLHERPTSANELVKEVTTYNYIIAFRLHCQIVASSFTIPSYGFVWDEKVKEFYEKLSMKNYSYPNSDIDINSIIKKIATSSTNDLKKAIDLGNHSKNTLLRAIREAYI